MKELESIPAPLLCLEHGCGVVSTWLALRRFRKRVAWKKVAQLCRYRKRAGTYAISIAVALRKCGLVVAFCTDDDDDKQPIELSGYRAADRLGIPIREAMTIGELRQIVKEKLVIVLFDMENGDGHFSPVTAVDKTNISFAYSNEPSMPLRIFESRWSAPRVCRQAIIVG